MIELVRVYDQEARSSIDRSRGAAQASGYYFKKVWRFCERSDAVDGALQVKRPIYKQDRYGFRGGRCDWVTH